MTISFQDHCKSLNIELKRDDIVFIKRCLENIPQNERKRVLSNYISEWLLGIDETKTSYKKQNLGRRRANTFILYEAYPYLKDKIR